MGGEVRDPRRDPRPGDVLETASRTRRVRSADVYAVGFSTPGATGINRIWLTSWRRWARTAVVVTVAKEEA